MDERGSLEKGMDHTLFHLLPMVLKVYSSSMGSTEFSKQSPISNFINISLVDSKLWLLNFL